MYSFVNLFLIVFGTLLLAQFGLAKEFIWLQKYQCEGKHGGNYTNVVSQQSNEDCTQDSINWGTNVFIENGPKGDKTTIGVVLLATSRFPAGADVIVDALYLFTGGSLAGTFGLARSKHLVRDYLKKCSSVLGLSIITSTKIELLITDNLNINALISPTGAYEVFKKSSPTVCNGVQYGV